MKTYLKLLIRREVRELTGRNYTNMWLLTLMLVATFTSIAFSEGSMKYLEDKMSDPFTNWVNIDKSSDDNRSDDNEFSQFRDLLYDDANKERFGYSDVLFSNYKFYNMWGRQGGEYPTSVRFFEHLKSPLIKEVLKPENVIKGCHVDSTLLGNESLGLIISIGAAKRLGYSEKNLPTYVSILRSNVGADSLGLTLVSSGNKYLPVALPVLAIVRRLPGNVQMLAGMFLYEQLTNDDTHPFDFNSHVEEYLESPLGFFVTDNIEASFRSFVPTVVPEALRSSLTILEGNSLYHSMRPWRAGNILQISIGDGSTPRNTYQEVANAIINHFQDQTQVCRVFPYKTKTPEIPSMGIFLSVEFKTLDHIHEFESFANDYNIQLEMEQVHSKENFQAVATMAHVLSAAMVIFSIICIIMFLVNMLQSYFQKVKRNIGTFKAFGMGGHELIGAYILLLISLVGCSVVLALLVTWGIQELMGIAKIGKDGFNYLSLWNSTTYTAVSVIFVSTICTVFVVMVRLLSRTPGDLIYDRD